MYSYPGQGDVGFQPPTNLSRFKRVWVRLYLKEVVTIVDSDGDGVPDSSDNCPDTPNGESVDANGCSAAQLIALSVEDNILDQTFKMYPNPTINVLNFSARNDIISVNIFTMSGQKVLFQSSDLGISNINISQLTKGLYLAQFTDKDSGKTSRLIVKK